MSQANAMTTNNASASGVGRYGRYVGRVGALAVALGVGVAIATTPGVAWAGPDTDSTNNAGASGGGGSTDTKPDTKPGTKPDTTPAAAGSTPTGTSESQPASGATTTAGDTTPPDRESAASTTPKGTSAETTQTADDANAAPATGEEATAPADSAPPAESAPQPKKNNPPRDTTPTSSDPLTAVAATVANLTQSVISLAVPHPAPADPPTSLAASAPTAAAAAAETSTTAIEPETTPAPAPAPGIAAAVTQLIASVLAPFFTPAPESPPAPTLIWTVLAWIRREIDTTTTKLGNPPTDETLTSEPVAPTAFARSAAPTTLAAATTPPPPPPSGVIPTVSFVVAGVGNIVGGLLGGLGALLAGNQAPINGAYTATSPNFVTGAVTVTATATDPNGDPLTFSAPASTAKGTITTNANGTFTYTPTTPARITAEGTPGPDTDTFAITVSDGRGGTTTVPVTVTVAPALVVTHTLTLPGSGSSSSLNADLTRLTVTTTTYDATTKAYTTHLAVVDTTTGTQVGNTLSFSGIVREQWDVPTTSDRKIFVTTDVNYADPVDPSQPKTTWLTVVDTKTGAQIGTTTAYVGGFTQSNALTANGSRKLLITFDPTNAGTTRVSVIDTTTATRLGSTIASPAGLSQTGDSRTGVAITPDGSRAVITTSDAGYFSTAGLGRSWVSVIDTVHGTQLGSTFTMFGVGGTELTPDGSRALVSAIDRTYNNGNVTNDSTQFAVIDTATGALTRPVTTLAGTGQGLAHITSDGSRVVIQTTRASDFSTRTTIFNASTGAQVGNTIIVSSPYSSTSVSGNRVLITDTTGSSNVRLRVFDAATGAQLGAPVDMPGTTYLHGVNRINGQNQYFQTTYIPLGNPGGGTSYATLVDLNTGSLVRQTEIPGELFDSQFNSDRSHVLVTSKSATGTARIAVFDTNTGAQVGNTLTKPSSGLPRVTLTPDGNHAWVGTTGVTLVDLASGGQIGPTTPLPGSSYVQVFNPNGSKFVVITSSDDNLNHTINVFDSVTGNPIGTPVAANGGYFTGTYFRSDGNRITVTTEVLDGSDWVTQATVVDLAAGTRAGQVIVPGEDIGFYPTAGPAGKSGINAVLATTHVRYDSATNDYSYTSPITLINTNTGAVIGGPTVVDGGPAYVYYNAADKYATVVTIPAYTNASSTTTFGVTHVQTG